MGPGMRVPARVRYWLGVKTSLTRALESAYGQIQVQVFHQRTDLPYGDEAVRAGGPCIIRDVALKSSNQQIRVLAHSVLPLSPRGRFHPLLKRLGRQALGSMLFTRPGFVRRQREWAALDERHPLYQWAQMQVTAPLPKCLWARRASFSLLRDSAQTVQVTELFLNVKSPA